MSVPFVCEGCGVKVFQFGWGSVPQKGFCSICEWLEEHLRAPDMTEFWEVYDRIAKEHRSPREKA
jgi:hypothetical protein